MACCVTMLAVSFESAAAQGIINGFDPPSARTAGLGGASVAILGDAAAIFANPTGIATLRAVGPECADLPVSETAQVPRSDVALVLCRGFGGMNVALLLRAS